MTPEQLREAAAVMLAAADGKKIEHREYEHEPWRDSGSLHLHISWNWNRFQYRIKPEPRKVRIQVFRDASYPHTWKPFDVSKESPPTWWIPVSDIVEIEVRDE